MNQNGGFLGRFGRYWVMVLGICGLRAQLGCVRASQEVGLVMKMCPTFGNVAATHRFFLVPSGELT